MVVVDLTNFARLEMLLLVIKIKRIAETLADPFQLAANKYCVISRTRR